MPANRFRPLDGIRGLAVFLVVVHHWTTIGGDANVGNLGIQLFFALSGFLITGILLDLRFARERGEIRLRDALARFWQSRVARVVPVVVLTLVAISIAGERIEPRANLAWHATFTSNILFFLQGNYHSNLAHFWSLAVEQQFYLMWPFVILFAPRRRLELLLFALVILAPLARFALFNAGFTNFAEYNVLPFSNFDSLGAGSLLAVWMREEDATTVGRLHMLSILAVAALAAFVANRVLGEFIWNPEQFFGAILSAWLIAEAVRNPSSWTARAFSWTPLVALGTISYGVYAYHAFAPRAVGFALRHVGAPASFQSGPILLLLSAIVTALVAAGSWFLMEKPIMDARRRWQRRASRAPAVPGGQANSRVS
jgi:peptidoglycan/LPS O-acetylase OafA/YrhL